MAGATLEISCCEYIITAACATTRIVSQLGCVHGRSSEMKGAPPRTSGGYCFYKLFYCLHMKRRKDLCAVRSNLSTQKIAPFQDSPTFYEYSIAVQETDTLHVLSILRRFGVLSLCFCTPPSRLPVLPCVSQLRPSFRDYMFYVSAISPVPVDGFSLKFCHFVQR